jgi:hypothetical protein
MKKINLLLSLLFLFGLTGFYACKKKAAETNAGESKTLNRAVTPFPTLPAIFTVPTFNREPIASGGVVVKKFTFPVGSEDLLNVSKVLMYVRLNCPAGGCPPWDVFAIVRLMKSNGNDAKTYGYELGRWITPYGKDNSSIISTFNTGWVIDVTDFRSLLVGDVTLETRAEVWSGTWQVSIDFEYIKGTPEYKYSTVLPIMEYNTWSTSGIAFGKGTVTTNSYNGKQTGFSIQMPANAEKTSFRTIISGWGHAQPFAQGERGFAEWAFRTHRVNINDAPTFTHDMGSLGCETNPKVVKLQAGNWKGNRAGWCPGMDVPVRTDILTNPRAGQIFNFNYVLQEDQWNPANMTEKWRDSGIVAPGNEPGAYYALSSYIVVQSNTPITTQPVVSNRQ